MTRDEIARAIAARPEQDLRDAVAWAAYAALLDAQERGEPGSVRAALLGDFVAVARHLRAAAAALAEARPL